MLRRLNMYKFVFALIAFGLITPLVFAQHPRPQNPSRQIQIPTTALDFYHPGSQPDATGYDYVVVSRFSCVNCHRFENDGNTEEIVPPYNNWVGSLMAQSARDPVFHAAMTIANQDVNDSGTTCIRCHMPGGFLQGRAMPSDGSALIADDFDGVSCDICHRMVDPEYAFENPIEDYDILQNLANTGDLPTQPGNGSYIFDPSATRRGPLDDVITNSVRDLGKIKSSNEKFRKGTGFNLPLPIAKKKTKVKSV